MSKARRRPAQRKATKARSKPAKAARAPQPSSGSAVTDGARHAQYRAIGSHLAFGSPLPSSVGGPVPDDLSRFGIKKDW